MPRTSHSARARASVAGVELRSSRTPARRASRPERAQLGAHRLDAAGAGCRAGRRAARRGRRKPRRCSARSRRRTPARSPRGRPRGVHADPAAPPRRPGAPRGASMPRRAAAPARRAPARRYWPRSLRSIVPRSQQPRQRDPDALGADVEHRAGRDQRPHRHGAAAQRREQIEDELSGASAARVLITMSGDESRSVTASEREIRRLASVPWARTSASAPTCE